MSNGILFSLLFHFKDAIYFLLKVDLVNNFLVSQKTTGSHFFLLVVMKEKYFS